MSTHRTTGEHKSEESNSMGVASLSANKRRLESPDVGDEDYVVAKVAKKATASELIESAAEVQDTIIGNENSSDFLATSILARTLLTSTSVSQCSPLESLCSTLEALPAPSLLLSDGTDDIRSTFLSTFKTTIHETTDLEFTSLLCHERPLSTVTVLSPIDEDAGDWSSANPPGPPSPRKTSKVSAGCLSGSGGSMNNGSGDQVITEDETGKSYYNLGSADTTISVKKSSPVTSTAVSMVGGVPTPPSNPVHMGDGGGWPNGCNNNNNAPDFHDDGSSSSCESISSEDLFTSEEFDASEDEEELRSYKQQRATVLHLSLCKLNSFRTQQCVEPSLHRSVLICNTLRHIEQEIRNEDEIPARAPPPLPPFWGSQNNLNSGNNGGGNTGGNNNAGSGGGVGPPGMSPNNMNQPQITDVRPSPSHVPTLHGHDPYLSPNTYSNNTEAPYYDYSSLRPHPTPFHTASYEYEQDLPLVSGSPATVPSLLDVSSPPSILECDSGYAEDLNLSSYYYNTPPRTGMGTHSDGVTSPASNTSASNTTSSSPPGDTYLNCGYSSLTIRDSPVVPASCTEPLLSDSSLLSPTSDMSDIEIHNSLTSLPLPPATAVEARSNCDYMNNNNNNNSGGSNSSSSANGGSPNSGSTSPTSNSSSSSSSNGRNSGSSSSSSDGSESENSVSPPPSSLMDSATSSSGTALCWPKLSPPSPNMAAMNKEITNSTSLLHPQQQPQHPPFVQQESHQCGMESRLTEFSRSHSNFNNPHHHNLPMDSLISANYSNSL